MSSQYLSYKKEGFVPSELSEVQVIKQKQVSNKNYKNIDKKERFMNEITDKFTESTGMSSTMFYVLIAIIVAFVIIMIFGIPGYMNPYFPVFSSKPSLNFYV